MGVEYEKEFFSIVVYAALTIAFTGCQSDSSCPKTGMPKIDFSKSLSDNATSFSPVKKTTNKKVAKATLQ